MVRPRRGRGERVAPEAFPDAPRDELHADDVEDGLDRLFRGLASALRADPDPPPPA